MRETQNVLVDIDGTLIDSNRAHAMAWRQYLAEHLRTPLPLTRVQRMIGMGADKIIPEIFGPDKFSERQIKKMAEERDELYLKEFLPLVRPVPGAVELMRDLASNGYRVVLATSAKEPLLESAFKLAPVQKHILGYTTADESGESKPSPDILESAMAKYGFSPKHTAMIGDSPYDMLAAKRAGCRAAVAVRTGNFPDEELYLASEIFDTVDHLRRNLPKSVLAV